MGGSSTTSTKVPKYMQDAAQAALAKANQVAGLNYTPYYGVDVAAQTPLQMAAMRGTNQAASAFGVPMVGGGGVDMVAGGTGGDTLTSGDPYADFTMGMPVARTMNGVQGYSSGDMYDLALAELKKRNPEQFAALTAQFGPPTAPAQATPTAPQGGGAGGGGGNRSVGAMSPQSGSTTPNTIKYASLRDMIDGGGAGQRGGTFSGGPFSGALNSLGVTPRQSTSNNDQSIKYSSLRDRFDGGGAGQRGSEFSGGILSKIINNAGVKPLPPRTATAAPAARPATVVKPAPRPLSGRI